MQKLYRVTVEQYGADSRAVEVRGYRAALHQARVWAGDGGFVLLRDLSTGEARSVGSESRRRAQRRALRGSRCAALEGVLSRSLGVSQ